MSAYDRLAFSYDALTYDIPYEAMLNFVEAILQERNLAPQTVLDLACGPAPCLCCWRKGAIR